MPEGTHYTATLKIISLHSPPQKTKIVYFRSCARVWASNVPVTGCTCLFFVSVVLVVPQPVDIRVLNQLTSCSVWFNSRSYVSLPGEMTPVFNHFKSPCRSEKRKASSQVISQKNTHQTFREEYIYRKVSVHCTVSAEHPACYSSSNASLPSSLMPAFPVHLMPVHSASFYPSLLLTQTDACWMVKHTLAMFTESSSR